MTASKGPTAETPDVVNNPPEDDPADLTGQTSDATAGMMHDETDDIAAQADPDSPGHGPNTD